LIDIWKKMANHRRGVRDGGHLTPRKLLERAALTWLLVGAAALANCGGMASGPDPTSTVDAGDSGMPNGGSPSAGPGGATAGRGGTASGGADPSVIMVGGKSDTPPDECDWKALLTWVRVAVPAVVACWWDSVPGPDETLRPIRGAIVIDDDGRVIDNTGLEGDAKQSWLDKLANQRWLCLAGQTIGYECKVGA
jgi:hypothetical protein